MVDPTMSEKSDVEALISSSRQNMPSSSSTTALEYRTPTSTKFTHLTLYMLLNLSLTLYNKAVLGSFHCPWLLTALHATSASIGCSILLRRGHFQLTKLDYDEHLVLLAFSTLFTLNIAMSNVSLALVSIPFHQILRSTTPLATLLLQTLLYTRTYPAQTYLSLLPLILGVALATYGDYAFTRLGFFLTLLGTLLAAIKTIATNRLLTGRLKLPAPEVLLRMSPLAAAQSLLFAWYTGELGRFIDALQFTTLDPTTSTSTTVKGAISQRTLLALLPNGLLAFALNMSSFQTNKLAGALTMTVAGNVKQCLTILLGVVLFDVKVGWLNGVGMAIAVAGGGWYSFAEMGGRGRRGRGVG